MDFAKLAAAQLVPVVHVPVEGGEKRTTDESFEKGGFCLVRNRDDLGQTVEDLMCKMCCPVFETADENYVPPPPLNDNLLHRSVLVRSGASGRPADGGPETRRKILFCDGMLYDFKERVLRSPIPADRMGFHAKATSEMWQPSKATKLFEHILAFLKEHLETGVCLLEASENGSITRLCSGKNGSKPELLVVIRAILCVVACCQRRMRLQSCAQPRIARPAPGPHQAPIRLRCGARVEKSSALRPKPDEVVRKSAVLGRESPW